MKFQYSTVANTFDTKGHFTKRPMLKLELTSKDGRKIQAMGLVDSGADQTMVNIQYANFLGIDLSKAVTRDMRGISDGALSTKLSSFPLKSVELGEEIIIPACYTDSKNVDILIGQEGFFDNYRIKFEKDHDIFEINHVKK